MSEHHWHLAVVEGQGSSALPTSYETWEEAVWAKRANRGKNILIVRPCKTVGCGS